MERKNAWLSYDAKQKKALTTLGEEYRKFLSLGKTERECVDLAVEEAQKAGYISLEEARAKGKLKAGDKVYATIMGKSMALFTIGKEPLEKGMNILGAHIDSPRLDLKQNPLYEDTDQVLLDTHYYGGIKKYQWVALPLALHGVVAKKDGSVVKVCIGEDPADPVVGITDLLPHLAGNQMNKPAGKIVEGEDLNVLIGSEKVAEDKPKKAGEDSKASVLKNIKDILKEQYNIEEEDFISAEIEVVPAGPARDFGLDRSMIMGYGHDDRICAYTSLVAMLNVKKPQRTSCCLLVDKEEIGSVGATGMHSLFFENTVAEIMALCGEGSDLALRRALAASRMLSSDVSAAFDPNYPGVNEKKNTAYMGRGLVFNKYTGSRGKGGSNDCSAEYMAYVRRVMDEAGVFWQTAELGKVDEGGGGTIAYIAGNYGMNVVDAGIAVLSMHAPWELASKADIYEAVKGYEAFLKAE